MQENRPELSLDLVKFLLSKSAIIVLLFIKYSKILCIELVKCSFVIVYLDLN